MHSALGFLFSVNPRFRQIHVYVHIYFVLYVPEQRFTVRICIAILYCDISLNCHVYQYRISGLFFASNPAATTQQAIGYSMMFSRRYGIAVFHVFFYLLRITMRVGYGKRALAVSCLLVDSPVNTDPTVTVRIIIINSHSTGHNIIDVATTFVYSYCNDCNYHFISKTVSSFFFFCAKEH